MTLLAFLIGGLLGHRLWRGTLALLLDEIERAQADEQAGREPVEPPVTWVDHVPVLGPVLSMTRDARLGQMWFPPRELPPGLPLVGLTCGLALATFASRLGPSWPLVGVGPLVVVLIVAGACDLISGVVLDELSGHAFLWTGAYVLLTQLAAAAGALPPALEPAYAYDGAAIRLDTALIGLAVLGLLAWVVNLRALIRGGLPGIGGGVVKLLLAIAVLTGWRGALCALVIGFLLATAPALVAIAYLSRQQPGSPDEEPAEILFPFVAFVALGTLVTLWFGHPAIIQLWLDWNGRVVTWIVGS